MNYHTQVVNNNSIITTKNPQSMHETSNVTLHTPVAYMHIDAKAATERTKTGLVQ